MLTATHHHAAEADFQVAGQQLQVAPDQLKLCFEIRPKRR
jgi:hypothetical protein